MTNAQSEKDGQLQQYLSKYWTAPSVFGSVEPFVTEFAMDPTYGGYNIAKSSYQTRTDVFNLAYLAKEVGKPQDEVEKKLKKMIDEHTIMLVQNPNTYVLGWAIYYWFVKLRNGFTPDQKEEVADHIQNKDETCTATVGEGDFDFFGGNHIGVLDFLINEVVKPIEAFPQVESVHILPVARYLREEKVAQWRAPEGTIREFFIADEEIARLPKAQRYWDETDVKIFCALNKKRAVKDFFDFSVLAELSGLKAEVLKKSMKSYVEELPIMIPLVAPNWRKLGLTKHYFVVRLYRMLPTENRYAIADELAKNPAWETLWQFTQASYDIIMSAYNQINDIDKLREEIRAIPGVEEIREFDIHRATRRWTCRLDEEAGFWESCIMTSDIGVDIVDPREKEIYPLGEYNLKKEGE